MAPLAPVTATTIFLPKALILNVNGTCSALLTIRVSQSWY